MKIPRTMHVEILRFYASKAKFSEGMRVRDWVSQKSFQEQ